MVEHSLIWFSTEKERIDGKKDRGGEHMGGEHRGIVMKDKKRIREVFIGPKN